MRRYRIVSKTFGTHDVLLDDTDYQSIVKLGGRWCVALKRGKYYPQKRLPGNKLVEMHRYLLNPCKKEYVDHINGNTLDNRRCNLRICSNSANLRNAKIRVDNKSGATGVFFHRETGKWSAYIKVKYRRKHLGMFDKFENALSARNRAVQKYWSV